MNIILPGQMIGSYRVMNQIGQGGMATVYRAFQPSMNRYVALKVLPSQLAEEPEFSGRFRQEAQIIANLEHPHILPVYEFGENDGISYLVMRYLDHGTLKDRMAERALTTQEIARWFSQIVDALEYAHTHNVIHRDVKPSNVLLDDRSNCYLTDFGIAKLLESTIQFTSTGALIGTPHYMSPEQAQSLAVDRRTDIYSLGIILYEMVTGRVPFDAETPLAVILKHIGAPLPLPSMIKPGLSPAIERVLLKALAKAPADRFGTMEEFHTAWGEALVESATLAGSLPHVSGTVSKPPEPVYRVEMPSAASPAGGVPEKPVETTPQVAPASVAKFFPESNPQGAPVVPLHPGGVPEINPQPIQQVETPVQPVFHMAVPAEGTVTEVVRSVSELVAPAEVESARGANEEPGQPMVSQQTAGQVKKRLPVWGLVALTEFLLGMGLVALVLIAINRMTPSAATPERNVVALTQPPLSEKVRPTATQKTSTNTPTTKPPTPQPMKITVGPMTSWVSANHPWSVVIQGGLVRGGGIGLSTWDLNGRLVKRLNGPFDGLPDVYVSALATDLQGILWVGTGSGLVRLDGDHSLVFNEANGLDSKVIGALAVTDKGLLVGTKECMVGGCGLGWLGDKGYQPVEGFPSVVGGVPGELSQNVTALLPLGETLWVGTTNGLARQEGGRWTTFFNADGLPDLVINAILLDQTREGAVWVGTNSGAAWFDGQRFTVVERLANTMILDILQDGTGSFWFTTQAGITRFNPTTHEWKSFGEQDGLLPDTYYHIALHPNGMLFFGSDHGLVRFDGKDFVTWSEPNGPAYNDFKRILPGPDPTRLWMIGEGSISHPDVFDTRSESWSTEIGLPEGCAPLAVNAQATWCGGPDGMWIVRRDGPLTHISKADGLPSNLVSEIKLLPDGSAWVATLDKGLAFYDGKKISQVFSVEQSGLTSNVIRTLLPASDGTLWVGTAKGVDRLLTRGTWVHYPAGKPFSNRLEFVNDIVEDQNGAIWVAGWGEPGIVYRFQDGVWKRFAADVPGVKLPKETILCITLAPDGSLWFGSYYGGAARFDGKRWTLVVVRDGLVSGNVKDIYVDPQGTAWFATGVGVTRYVKP